jgi:hypothetical protein
VRGRTIMAQDRLDGGKMWLTRNHLAQRGLLRQGLASELGISRSSSELSVLPQPLPCPAQLWLPGARKPTARGMHKIVLAIRIKLSRVGTNVVGNNSVVPYTVRSGKLCTLQLYCPEAIEGYAKALGRLYSRGSQTKPVLVPHVGGRDGPADRALSRSPTFCHAPFKSGPPHLDFER